MDTARCPLSPKFQYYFKKGSSKNFLWASCLWVGRRKEPILGYVPKNDEKNLDHKGLIFNVFIASKILCYWKLYKHSLVQSLYKNNYVSITQMFHLVIKIQQLNFQFNGVYMYIYSQFTIHFEILVSSVKIKSLRYMKVLFYLLFLGKSKVFINKCRNFALITLPFYTDYTIE